MCMRGCTACWELALVVAGMFPIMVSVGWIQMRVTKGVGGRGKDAFEVVGLTSFSSLSRPFY